MGRKSRSRLRLGFRLAPGRACPPFQGTFLGSSSRRNSESSLSYFAVIPAQAGIHVAFEVQGFHSPCGRASHLSLLVQRKVTERNTPQVARSPGILPSECASGFRGSLSAHPCALS